jgi:DNA-binding NtrC family response regulator
MRKTLVLCGDAAAAEQLKQDLASHGSVRTAKLPRLAAGKVVAAECVLVDLPALSMLCTGGPTAGLDYLRELYPSIPIVLLVGSSERRHAVELLRAGADDYVSLPPNIPEILGVLGAATDAMITQSELAYLRDEVWDDGEDLLTRTKSTGMRQVLAQLRKVASARSTVLLTGETGTGKSVLARYLHRKSARASEPFVSVHCSAIPESLVESELFGHERGAFTGADRLKLGKFEIAAAGTVLLDEIGTIPAQVQIKLLQVLQDRRVQRVGGNVDIAVNARVIAATNEDLKALTKGGGFREDLFYRLNVFPIHVPPLRDRREDIPALARFFLHGLEQHYGKGITDIDGGAIEALRSYPWPGNIRELENLIERAYILEDSKLLSAAAFPIELFAESAMPSIDGDLSLREVRQAAADNAERAYLEQQLTQNKGSIARTAAAAGITSRQLHKLMKKHGLAKEDYKLPQ